MTNKVIRGPNGLAFRDSTGKYTALSFPTKKGQVWISNKALGLVLGFILGLLTALEPSAARTLFFDWALKLTTLS
jgi:hypothetical protein